MTPTADLVAKGKILSTAQTGEGVATVVFHPLETNYELHLETAAPYAGELNRNVRGTVRVRARKVYSVPGGGNFVQPVIGTPRIIQGRVVSLDKSAVVVRAGATFVVELPTGPDTLDLHAGDIGAGTTVNVVAWPGARFEVSGES